MRLLVKYGSFRVVRHGQNRVRIRTRRRLDADRRIGSRLVRASQRVHRMLLFVLHLVMAATFAVITMLLTLTRFGKMVMIGLMAMTRARRWRSPMRNRLVISRWRTESTTRPSGFRRPDIRHGPAIACWSRFGSRRSLDRRVNSPPLSTPHGK